MIKILFILNFIFISKIKAYEWNQVTDFGIINKNVKSKIISENKELTFSELDFESKTLSDNEIHKKFPSFFAPKTILLLGDTGCRLKEGKESSDYQDCNDPKAWPLKQIVNSAEKENPDLIIHLGDYHYREKCSTGKPCQSMSAFVGYGWRPWELDFFQPMQKLFDKAPIIIVRGNHEDCGRAYLGYKHLLASSDWKKECLDYEQPQIILLEKDLALINFDSSAIPEKPTSDEEAIWIQRLNDINEKIIKLKIKNVWMITHKTIYGLFPFKTSYVPGNLNFKTYFEKSSLKDTVKIILSGHIHNSMIVRPKAYAKQIVLGNSGTQLDNFQAKITQEALDAFSYTSANVAESSFGYAIIKKRSDNNWDIIFKDINGKDTYKDTF